MLNSVVVWKWAKPGYRSTFTAEHVNTMRRMVARHYPDPHRFICITDDPAGIDPEVETVDLWSEHGDLENPTWPKLGPSCYRRLRAFAPEFEEIAGRKFVCIDLDCVITGDLRPLWNRPEDFVIYGPAVAHFRYNGSMWMMTAGSRRQVWDTFDPEVSPRMSHRAGIQGSDQAWIQYVLGPREARWTLNDGVLAYRRDCLRGTRGLLPKTARVVVFHGKPDPWSPEAMNQSPWIREHYR
jgi:hypothetical protein